MFGIIQAVFIVPVVVAQEEIALAKVQIAHAQMLKHVYRIHTEHTFLFMWKTLTFKMPRPLNQLALLLGIFKENTLCINF